MIPYEQDDMSNIGPQGRMGISSELLEKVWPMVMASIVSWSDATNTPIGVFDGILDLDHGQQP